MELESDDGERNDETEDAHSINEAEVGIRLLRSIHGVFIAQTVAVRFEVFHRSVGVDVGG